MSTFLLKVHTTENGSIVAACDKNILGETFTDGNVTLTVEDGFYGGDEASIDDIVDATETATTTNFVGAQIITALIKQGVVDEEEVHYVDEVPHVQLFFI